MTSVSIMMMGIDRVKAAVGPLEISMGTKAATVVSVAAAKGVASSRIAP